MKIVVTLILCLYIHSMAKNKIPKRHNIAPPTILSISFSYQPFVLSRSKIAPLTKRIMLPKIKAAVAMTFGIH